MATLYQHCFNVKITLCACLTGDCHYMVVRFTFIVLITTLV